MASKRGANARTAGDSAFNRPCDQRHANDPSVLYLSIDYGTKNLPVAYRLGELDDDIHNIELVRYSFKSPEVPQRVAWLPNGEFLWGYHVDDARKAGQIQWKDIVEFWKVALYKGHHTDPTAKRVISHLEKLGKGSVEDLVRIHLAAIIKETKLLIRKQEKRKNGRDIDIDSLPLRLFLNVPQLWSPPANRIMTQAAKAAGVDWVEVVYEAQSAIGYYLAYLKNSHFKALSPGDHLAVADTGGATGDFGLYELLEGLERGATVRLKSLATLKGAFCGSQFVNENFIAWLKNKEDFAERCEKLKLSESEVVNEADRQFNNLKHSFESPRSPPADIVIHPAPGADAASWLIFFDNNQMASFFKPIIENIIDCIDSLITPRTKQIFIPGGFGKSEYLRKIIEARYHGVISVFGQSEGNQMLEHPVARGALVRYKTIGMRGLVSTMAFGIARDEEYDMDLHRDATYETGQIMANGYINNGSSRPNRSIVTQDPQDHRDNVEDRWRTLLHKGAIVAPGQDYTTNTWQRYCVDPGEQRISEQIYCSEIHLRDHDPISNGRGIQWAGLRDGTEPYGPLLVMNLPDLAKEGFKLRWYLNWRKRRVYYYQVYARMLLRCHGANMGLQWEVARADSPPYDADGRLRESADVNLLERSDEYELCGEAFSPFPRTATG